VKVMSKRGLGPLLCVFCVFIVLVSARASVSDETSLFDFRGRAVAYFSDEDGTIYLWEGKPVAYLDDRRRDGQDIYGFNGKHLGWFRGGIAYDEDGNTVGGVKEAFTTPTQLEPLKGLKELRPLKSLKELRPLLPLLSKQWSELPLKYFLKEGIGSE
jgi:hypothetical protein